MELPNSSRAMSPNVYNIDPILLGLSAGYPVEQEFVTSHEDAINESIDPRTLHETVNDPQAISSAGHQMSGIAAQASVTVPPPEIGEGNDVIVGQAHPNDVIPKESLKFGSRDAARNAMSTVDLALPANDLTVPSTDADRIPHVQKLFDAFCDVDDIHDKLDSRSIMKRWLRKDEDGNADLSYYGKEALEKVCWDVIDTCEQLHRGGPSFMNFHDPTHLTSLLKGAQSLTFEQRVNALAEVSKHSKNRVDAMMKGEYNAIVLNPEKALKTSETNKESNLRKQKHIKKGREVDDPAPLDPTDDNEQNVQLPMDAGNVAQENLDDLSGAASNQIDMLQLHEAFSLNPTSEPFTGYAGNNNAIVQDEELESRFAYHPFAPVPHHTLTGVMSEVLDAQAYDNPDYLRYDGQPILEYPPAPDQSIYQPSSSRAYKRSRDPHDDDDAEASTRYKRSRLEHQSP